MPLFWFIFCILRYSYIHLITFIRYIYPSPFAEVYLHIFIAGQLSGKTSLWCRAENQTRACLTASRRSSNWATPHHNWATPHHNWATPHHTEQRRTILSNPAPSLTNAAPYWATPHHAAQRRTILSNAAPSEQRRTKIAWVGFSPILYQFFLLSPLIKITWIRTAFELLWLID